MFPPNNVPSRYNPAPSHPATVGGARPAAHAPTVNCPQWLYASSINKQSLQTLANIGHSGSADERALSELFQRHLSNGPISLKTPPDANNPRAIYSANTKLNGANVEVRATFGLDANQQFELKELAMREQKTGKQVNIKMQQAQGAPAPANAQASGSTTRNQATGLNQRLIEQTPPGQLDRRGNDVGATRRESSWAVHTLQNISPAQAKMFLPHIFDLINTTNNYKQAYNTYLQQTPGMTQQTFNSEMARFGHVDALKKSLGEGVKNREPATQLMQRLVDTLDFKKMLDLTGALLELTNKDIHDTIRDQPFFTDRGRTLLREDQVRDSSLFNRHAGITEEPHRSPSTENFFKQGIVHAKADYVREPNSLTSKQFSRSGVPFISGASGSMQFILQALEMQKPQAQRSPQERAALETLVISHAALLVAGGHHSLAETLLPGRKLGYFSDLPDPLNGRNGYRDFTRALDTRLAALGMNGGVRLSAS